MTTIGDAAAESSVRAFWEETPCGERLIGAPEGDLAAYFARYDAIRYGREPHIPRLISSLDVAGKSVLEIGFGQGAEAEQLIRRGARWSGIDLTQAAVERTGARLALKQLPYDAMACGTARSLPWEDGAFDFVFSHGVLHHIPEVRSASREICRVLRPGGELVVMLYARRSLNYLLSIALLRRAGLALLYLVGARPGSIYADHVALAHEIGLLRYLRMENFIHRNTDGPGNPYSKVYSLRAVARDFAEFEIVRANRAFLHAPPLPPPLAVLRPLERVLGWHLWVHMRRRPEAV